MTAPRVTPASAHERMHLADATGTNPYAYATRMALNADQDTAAVWPMAVETYQREGMSA